MFIRLHLDYGDIVYDKSNNETFINKTEKAQYDAALAITGAIRGISRENFYTELRKLACFYKIQSTGLPKYLLQLIPTSNHSYILRKPLNTPHYYYRTDTFMNSFFPNVINEWNKQDEKITGAATLPLLRVSLLKMGHP